ncbi:ubiquitin domain-containing protein [Heterostelium album PN500]|uniref:Ubiquitin domain-containing protein n=1 Tax=Heterostelium pallidum (strain ATCC 26659 / Pp 5 / PN500) TaxID=670386 RepID=D3B3U3_HETP5|nr:ubiquitin domain-containing protein [Heterostelium album PN500]EFA83991.1 ubiquitin domain-containing protein [Heterostelium album PN500]|eukprot:XP_020436108.1 ubiquitin domain-containing protein [Heterostelium album PN500]
MAADNQPPPEISTIIEKTAEFVAKHGENFAEKVKAREKNNPKFNFLHDGDIYNRYFLNKVEAHRQKIQSAKPATPAAPTTSSPPTDTTATSTTPTTATATPSAPSTTTTSPTTTTTTPPAPTVTTPAPPAEPEQPQRVITEPTPLLYILEVPDDMNSLDYDTIRLTAQFVAMNGEQFQSGLALRESKNAQFEFLKPTHHWHEWFRALVESYAAIIYPPKNIKEMLATEDFTDKNTILDRSINRFEWNKQEQIAKKKAEEEADQERAMFAAIDWHDFVVVDTIDFTGDDLESLPPPKTFEQLIKHQFDEDADREEEMDVEMDTEMDMDDGDSASTTATSEKTESKLKIVKDYQKTNKPVASTQKKITQACPICKQEIPLDEMQEHMRIELMMRNNAKKDNSSNNFGGATLNYDTDIAKNLQSFANSRTDIFGDDDDVEQARKKAAEEPAVEKVIWDGHTGSIPRTQNAAYAAQQEKQQSHHQKQQQQQQQQGMSMQDMYMQQQAAAAAGMMPQNYMMMGMMPFPPGVPFMPGMMPPPMNMMNPNAATPITNTTSTIAIDEPTSKKQKTEDLLIPEDEYIRDNPGPVQITIEATNEGNAQTFSITFNPRDTITILKEKIKDLIGIAPNKQKLKAPGLSILKDQHTIGFYNLKPGTVITAGLKERGGRKK